MKFVKYFLSIFLSTNVCLGQEDLFTNERIKLGLVLPYQVDALTGEDVFLRMTDTVSNQEKCLFHKNGAMDVSAPVDNVIEWKSEKCGIRIKNISVANTGLWRLTSSAENNKRRTTGVTFVNVREQSKLKVNGTLTYEPNMNIAPEGTSYCYVVRPDQPKTMPPQHSKCVFPELYDPSDANGKWNVISGIEGRTDEMNFEINVAAVKTYGEELKTFVHMDTIARRMSMKCKLINTDKVIRFCRFVRMIDEIGYNLIPGQGNEKYRYSGGGFETHECGIEISNPDSLDRGFWKCLIGVYQENPNMESTVGAIIDGNNGLTQSTRYDIDADDVYGLQHTQVNILCKSNYPAEYCWFRHPSGRKIPVSDVAVAAADDQYRYFGSGVHLGDCGVSVMAASVDDSGTWSCHMGTIHQAGIESSKEISVRVSESHLVSSSLFQDVPFGTTLLLECKTVPEHIPIKYCRFVLPDGTGFSINEDSTRENLLLDNYYFNPNRKMRSGYCSIIVKHVTKKHIGQWTCAGRLVGRSQENWDDFGVHVYDNEAPSAAAISGMLIGAVFVLIGIAAAAISTYRRKYMARRERINNDNISDSISESAAIPMGSISQGVAGGVGN